MELTPSFFKKRNLRFKTITELVKEYGPNWADYFIMVDPEEALMVMSYFGGKVVYPEIVIQRYRNVFLYSPIQVHVHINMLTTCSIPKYDSQGNVIKVGNIVRIEYLSSPYNEIPSDLRNEPGSLVRVLRVVDANDCLVTGTFSGTDKIKEFCIVTELRQPFSGGFIDQIQKTYSSCFKDGIVRALEYCYRVTKATEIEKEFFNKVTH